MCQKRSACLRKPAQTRRGGYSSIKPFIELSCRRRAASLVAPFSAEDNKAVVLRWFTEFRDKDANFAVGERKRTRGPVSTVQTRL